MCVARLTAVEAAWCRTGVLPSQGGGDPLRAGLRNSCCWLPRAIVRLIHCQHWAFVQVALRTAHRASVWMTFAAIHFCMPYDLELTAPFSFHWNITDRTRRWRTWLLSQHGAIPLHYHTAAKHHRLQDPVAAGRVRPSAFPARGRWHQAASQISGNCWRREAHAGEQVPRQVKRSIGCQPASALCNPPGGASTGRCAAPGLGSTGLLAVAMSSEGAYHQTTNHHKGFSVSSCAVQEAPGRMDPAGARPSGSRERPACS